MSFYATLFQRNKVANTPCLVRKSCAHHKKVEMLCIKFHRHFAQKTPFCSCKLCFKLNTTLGSILDAKLPVVEWRRLSRFPFKMTLVHACPLLSFEKISFLLKSCSWLFWYCLFLVGRGALRGIMLRHLLCKTISVRNMFASDFPSLHLAASYLDLLWVMIGSFDCLARVWWWWWRKKRYWLLIVQIQKSYPFHSM